MLIPPVLVIVREGNGKYIFSYVLNLLDVTILRNGKAQDRNLNVFKTKILSFYQNILQKMGRRNSSQMILHF